MTAPRVDVIIVNYRSAALVAAVLSRLRRDGPWPYGRVWVVDNSVEPSHTRELQTLIGQAGGDVVQLTLPSNVGFGAGCNVAWAHSTAPYVLLLNPDALIDPEAVGRLALQLQANPRVAAISPRTWWDHVGAGCCRPQPHSALGPSSSVLGPRGETRRRGPAARPNAPLGCPSHRRPRLRFGMWTCWQVRC